MYLLKVVPVPMLHNRKKFYSTQTTFYRPHSSNSAILRDVVLKSKTFSSAGDVIKWRSGPQKQHVKWMPRRMEKTVAKQCTFISWNNWLSHWAMAGQINALCFPSFTTAIRTTIMLGLRHHTQTGKKCNGVPRYHSWFWRCSFELLCG